MTIILSWGFSKLLNFFEGIIVNFNERPLISKYPIQSGSICNLWFIGQIFYIIQKGILAFENIKENNKNYCLEIIKPISELLKILKFI